MDVRDPLPRDVDTWEEYEALLESSRGEQRVSSWAADPVEVARRMDRVDYLFDEGLATALSLAMTLGLPLLLEGEPGVGKTAAAKCPGACARRPSSSASSATRD